MTWEVRESLLRLRQDAIENELPVLELMYGDSVIRLGWEVVDQYIVAAQRRSIDPPISGEN